MSELVNERADEQMVQYPTLPFHRLSTQSGMVAAAALEIAPSAAFLMSTKVPVEKRVAAGAITQMFTSAEAAPMRKGMEVKIPTLFYLKRCAKEAKPKPRPLSAL